MKGHPVHPLVEQIGGFVASYSPPSGFQGVNFRQNLTQQLLAPKKSVIIG
jgi:hypothetical protein